MSHRKGSTVVILNPHDGRKYTSLASAQAYVKRKAAVFENGGLRFVKDTPRSAFLFGVVEGSAEDTYDRAAGSGIASIESLEGLPAIGDVVKILMLRSGKCRREPLGRSGPVRMEHFETKAA